jgi:hypothetical protein
LPANEAPGSHAAAAPSDAMIIVVINAVLTIRFMTFLKLKVKSFGVLPRPT